MESYSQVHLTSHVTTNNVAHLLSNHFIPHKHFFSTTKTIMYYPPASTVASYAAPVYPHQNSYYNAPMLPGQQFYPGYHAHQDMMYPQSAAPIMMQRPSYGYHAPAYSGYYGSTPMITAPNYYGHGSTPTVITRSRRSSSRHHRDRHHRDRRSSSSSRRGPGIMGSYLL